MPIMHYIIITSLLSTDPSHERSHSDSMGSLVVCDSSLKRQLKDLQRCDVSLTRYQSTLAEVHGLCVCVCVCGYACMYTILNNMCANDVCNLHYVLIVV